MLWIVSSDHHVVTVKTRLAICKNTTRTTKTVHYDWSLFNNRYISDKYTISLRNKYDALQKVSGLLTPSDEYENFVYTHMETAA